MEKVTAFIPSEVIGAYVALSGLLAPLYKSDEFKWKWVLFFICLGLIPIVMALSYALRRKDGLPTPSCSSTSCFCSTSSGHGTMVDFTVFIAIASATARPTPSSVKG